MTIYLAANAIDILDPDDIGHLQIVYEDSLGAFWEIEVQSGLPYFTFTGTQRPHDLSTTPNFQNGDYYSITALDLGGRDSVEVWSMLVSINQQYVSENPSIIYHGGQNSNTYASNLLKIIGIDLSEYESRLYTPQLEWFPGVSGDILDNSNAIALAVNGTTGDDKIRGGMKNDVLNGGGGDDILIGGGGVNILDGGSGSNVFAVGRGVDIIIGAGSSDRMGFQASLIDIGGAILASWPGVTSIGTGIANAEDYLIPLMGGISWGDSWAYESATYTAVYNYPMDGPVWTVASSYFEDFSYQIISEPYYGVSGISYLSYFSVYYEFYSDEGFEELETLVNGIYEITEDDLIVSLSYTIADGTDDLYYIVISDYTLGDLGILLSGVETILSGVDTEDPYYSGDYDPLATGVVEYINNSGDYIYIG